MKVSLIYVIVSSFSKPVAVGPRVSGFVAFSKSSTLESVYQLELWMERLSARAVRRSAGAGAPAYFAGAGVGKLRQKLRQTKL
jgi:hypothetical protein